MEENTYSLLNILLFLIPNIYQPLLFITEKLQDRPKTNCQCDRQTERDCRLPILELLLEQKNLKPCLNGFQVLAKRQGAYYVLRDSRHPPGCPSLLDLKHVEILT